MTTAPRRAHAYWAKNHSGRFGSQIATFSPWRMPRAARPRASRSTRSRNSANETRTSPNTIASRDPYRVATASSMAAAVVSANGLATTARLLEAEERDRVPVTHARRHLRRELPEDTACPREEPVEHRRLEEPRRPHVEAHQEAVRHLLDQRLPRRIEWPVLGGERGLAQEVHPGEVDHEVRVAREQPLHARRRALAGVGEAGRRLPVRRERATECGGGRVGQLATHANRQPDLGGEAKDLPEPASAAI